MSAIAAEIHKSHWTGERIARLGFLLGLGWDAKLIAKDPIIASTPNNVHRQAQRFGLAFQTASSIRKRNGEMSFLGVAAAKRGVTVETLIDRLLEEINSEPTLIDNILDDAA